MEITKRLLEVITENTGVDVNIKSRKREIVECVLYILMF